MTPKWGFLIFLWLAVVVVLGSSLVATLSNREADRHYAEVAIRQRDTAHAELSGTQAVLESTVVMSKSCEAAVEAAVVALQALNELAEESSDTLRAARRLNIAGFESGVASVNNLSSTAQEQVQLFNNEADQCLE